MSDKPKIPKLDKSIEELGAGLIWVPWIPVTVATKINGETVWYKNRWKNLLLQIKFLFIKPKYHKSIGRYKMKTIDPSFYGKVEIKGVKNDEK